MPAIDGFTDVPSDVYADFLKAGERARGIGQHVPVKDRKGQRSLKNFSAVQLKSPPCATYSRSSSNDIAKGIGGRLPPAVGRPGSKAPPVRARSRGGARQSSALPPLGPDAEAGAEKLGCGPQQRPRANRMASVRRFDRRGAKPQHVEEPEADPDFGETDGRGGLAASLAFGPEARETSGAIAKVACPTPLKAMRHTNKTRLGGTGCKDSFAGFPAPSALMGSADASFFSDRLSAALGWCQPMSLHEAPDYVRVA